VQLACVICSCRFLMFLFICVSQLHIDSQRSVAALLVTLVLMLHNAVCVCVCVCYSSHRLDIYIVCVHNLCILVCMQLNNCCIRYWRLLLLLLLAMFLD